MSSAEAVASLSPTRAQSHDARCTMLDVYTLSQCSSNSSRHDRKTPRTRYQETSNNDHKTRLIILVVQVQPSVGCAEVYVYVHTELN